MTQNHANNADLAEKEIQQLLRSALPPVDTELRRDLWPTLLRRMEAPDYQVAWYDWVLMAMLGGCVVVAPQVIFQLLYQL